MSENSHSKSQIIKCPNCGHKLRIPKVSRVLKLRCPGRDCGHLFIYPTQTTLKKYSSLIFVRIKSHPILFGLLVTLWLLLVGTMYKLETISIKGSLYITVLCVGLWSLGSWVIESFKEKDTKWFYRKWFVLLNLFFLPPLGITLLWAGSKFRKPIKIAFTAIFGLWFISGALTRTTGSFHFSPEEEIASLIRVPKENIFIKPASYFVKTSFQDEILNKQIPLKKENLTIPQIVKVWGDSVVLVKSVDKEGEEIGLGSGFVITRNGGIITNYHVVESAYSVTIGLSNGKSYNKVSYITGDSSIDIVVLNVDTKDEMPTPLILGDSDDLQVGEQVLAIGNPYGWRNTLSDGLISGIREIEGLKLLQITAPISPGSSGGALFNMKGEVIGITTIASLWGAQNLNFAIPINSFKLFIENWKRK